MANNFERMLQLVNEFFDTRNDPDQISVSEEERQKLQDIHPATLSELANDQGPIVWILLIPTIADVMERFLTGAISEKQLLEDTPSGTPYDAIYLCSASVLPEFRKQGLAAQVTMDAITRIRQDHPIKSLFYWPFSDGGRSVALSLSAQTGLPLHERKP